MKAAIKKKWKPSKLRCLVKLNPFENNLRIKEISHSVLDGLDQSLNISIH